MAITQLFSLSQVVNSPTHFKLNRNQTRIDLTFVNNKEHRHGGGFVYVHDAISVGVLLSGPLECFFVFSQQHSQTLYSPFILFAFMSSFCFWFFFVIPFYFLVLHI